MHAWVLMDNHLMLKTPEPNLVEGMKWLQNPFTRRFNVKPRTAVANSNKLDLPSPLDVAADARPLLLRWPAP